MKSQSVSNPPAASPPAASPPTASQSAGWSDLAPDPQNLAAKQQQPEISESVGTYVTLSVRRSDFRDSLSVLLKMSEDRIDYLGHVYWAPYESLALCRIMRAEYSNASRALLR